MNEYVYFSYLLISLRDLQAFFFSFFPCCQERSSLQRASVCQDRNREHVVWDLSYRQGENGLQTGLGFFILKQGLHGVV